MLGWLALGKREPVSPYVQIHAWNKLGSWGQDVISFKRIPFIKALDILPAVFGGIPSPPKLTVTLLTPRQ